MYDILREGKIEALHIICANLFGSSEFPVTQWADSFPIQVILYGLIEAESKLKRTKGTMTQLQVSQFANTVMFRRHESTKCGEEEYITI